MPREKAESKRQKTADKAVPKVIAAKDLSELETKILLLLEKTMKGPSAAYSVSELTDLFGGTVTDIMSAATSLSRKGYIRFRRLAGRSPDFSIEPHRLVDLTGTAVSHTTDILDKIEKLHAMQDQTPKPVYNKVLDELSSELVHISRQLAEARRTRLSLLQRLQEAIEADKHKLAEVRLRMQIGQMDASEATRLAEQYENEIRELQTERASASSIGSPSGSDQAAARKEELERRISELSEMLEIERARHLVGETTEAQYSEQKAIVEREKQKAVSELQLLKNQSGATLGDISKRVCGLRDTKGIPDKVATNLLSELEALMGSADVDEKRT
jgi:hypothetical protein